MSGPLAAAMGLVRAVPVWLWAVAIALGWGAWQRHEAKSAAAALHQRETREAKSRELEIRMRLEETERRLKAQNEVVQSAQKSTDAARRDAAAAADASRRLRVQLAAFGSTPAGGNDPAASCACQAAATGPGVLADVLRGIDDRAGALAAAADAARISGLACERAYDALTVPAGKK